MSDLQCPYKDSASCVHENCELWCGLEHKCVIKCQLIEARENNAAVMEELGHLCAIDENIAAIAAFSEVLADILDKLTDIAESCKEIAQNTSGV